MDEVDRIDEWLDAGYGSCVLRETSYRKEVADAFWRFAGQSYDLLAWVTMPDHVHVCRALDPEWLLEKVVFTWKRDTAGTLNMLLYGILFTRDFGKSRSISHPLPEPCRAGNAPGR